MDDTALPPDLQRSLERRAEYHQQIANQIRALIKILRTPDATTGSGAPTTAATQRQ